MSQHDDWWSVEERPLHSHLPVVGGLITWFRHLWNSVAARWYVLQILEQQNAVNHRMAQEIDRLREELQAVQEIQVELDQEIQDRNRLHTGALYSVIDELERLRRKLTRLEQAVADSEGES